MTDYIRTEDFSSEDLKVYTQDSEVQLLRYYEPEPGIFIAESPKVIRRAMDAGYEPMSFLIEEGQENEETESIFQSFGEAPVYMANRETLLQLKGYTLTRGVLCAMRRPVADSVEHVCDGARRVVVIYGVVDSTNIGAIFRSAAALGIDAVLVTRNSCDPLNRRAVRVSMGSVFLVPWTWLDEPVSSLSRIGLKTVAMSLTDRSIPVDSQLLAEEPRLAIIMGTEGDGLPHETIVGADYVARIPMSHNVDSLNVAAAAAVAFWQLRLRDR